MGIGRMISVTKHSASREIKFQSIMMVSLLAIIALLVIPFLTEETEAQLPVDDYCVNFNADDYNDIAIGVSGENGDTGSVQIIYGSSAGLNAETTQDQIFDQNYPGMKGTAEANDFFGWDVISSFFNNDNFEDLAIGVPGENGAAGSVHVIYGSSSGLNADTTQDQIFDQNGPGMKGIAEMGDGFGAVIVT